MQKIRVIFLAFILGIVSIQCIWADDVGELVESARQGDLDKVKSLINKGVDVNAKDYTEYTALMWASNWGHLEIVKYLISKGANVNIKGFQNRTALMKAAIGGQLEVIKILVDNGANANIRNDDGYTALELATTDEIWDYLRPRTRDFNVNFALINSAKRGNLKQVKYYLSQGADINAKDNNGYTALMMAVGYVSDNHLEIIKYLISKGANLNAKKNNGGTALMTASCGNLEAVKALVNSNKFLYFFKTNRVDINAQNEHGETALMYALDCDFGGTKKFDIYFDIVKYLVENGANVNVKGTLQGSALGLAINNSVYPKEKNLEVAKYLISKGADSKQALINFTYNLEFVEYLINRGVDVNANICGETALSRASEIGRLEVVKYLISKGADVEKYGAEALINASAYGRLHIVKYLVSQGANVNEPKIVNYNVLGLAGTDAKRALGVAARNGKFQIVEYLVAQGANVNAFSEDRTALMWAVTGDYLEIVKFLVENGADVNAKDAFDIKVLSYAKSDKIREYLISVGARY